MMNLRTRQHPLPAKQYSRLEELIFQAQQQQLPLSSSSSALITSRLTPEETEDDSEVSMLEQVDFHTSTVDGSVRINRHEDDLVTLPPFTLSDEDTGNIEGGNMAMTTRKSVAVVANTDGSESSSFSRRAFEPGVAASSTTTSASTTTALIRSRESALNATTIKAPLKVAATANSTAAVPGFIPPKPRPVTTAPAKKSTRPISRPAETPRLPTLPPERPHDANNSTRIPPKKKPVSPTNHPPSTTATAKATRCSSVLALSCQAQTHPWESILIVLMFFLLLCYCRRRRTVDADDSSRGEYRRVASRFTAEAFDDALDEDDLDHGDYGGGGGADDDEEEASNAVYTNGKHHVIEMRTLDKGQLSLEEVNG